MHNNYFEILSDYNFSYHEGIGGGVRVEEPHILIPSPGIREN